MAKTAKRSCRFNEDFLKEEGCIPWLERSNIVQNILHFKNTP